jgi:ubiquinone/menaquinone biosynthesis C-methylase UbiE
MKIPERTYTKPSTEQLHKANYPDHWERYEFAVPYIKNRKLLDVACGSGYGTALLSKNGALHTIGLDINSNAIEWAHKYYGNHADFFAIEPDKPWPLETASIEAIVSMETIEHVSDVNFFLKEMERVLIPGGSLIISTPLNETQNRLAPQNLFHLREYNWHEFGELLSEKFKILERWTQISQAAEKWTDLKSTRTGMLFVALKKIIPNKIINHLRKIYSDNKNHGAGRIIQGKHDMGNVQIIVAIK